MKNHLCAALLVTSMLLGCANPPSPSSASSSDKKPSTLGETKTAAIEVCQPQGQRAYLSRMVCSDGSSAAYRRVGSVGERYPLPNNLTKEQSAALLQKLITAAPLKPGEPDHHVVDMYEVSCGATKRMIYMDMYHCNQPSPTEAPAGFVLR